MKPYDRARILQMYESGMMASDIAAELGCHRTTIYNHLRAAGVEIRDDRGRLPGAHRREMCGRELHPLMDEEGNDTEHVAYDGKGKRYCYSCAQMRWAMRAALKSIEREESESE